MLLVGASVLPSCAPVKEEPRTPAPAPAPAIQVVAPAAAVDAVLQEAKEAVTLTVLAGARQTFAGLGTSLGNWGGNYQKLKPEERALLSRLMWRETKFKILKLWFNMDDYSSRPGERNLAFMREQYTDSGVVADARANGMTTLLCAVDHYPPYMVAPGGNNWKGPIIDSEVEAFAAIVATAIQQFHDETGERFEATIIQNEPDLTPTQVVRLVKALRTELDARGLQSVKLIAPDSSSVDDRFYGMVDAVKADPAAWGALAGIDTHSYNMAATERAAAYVEGPDGRNRLDYWMTEASDNGPEDPGMTGVPALRAASLAARFLNDVNHRVTHWVHFLGYEQTGDGKDDGTRIIPFTTTQPFQYEILKKFYVYQQLAQAFDVGAEFRRTQSSLDGDMTYTFGRKPHLLAATARNPDGTWSIGIQNYTADSFSGSQGQADEEWTRSQGGYTPATPYKVTVAVAELAGANGMRFQVHRTNATQTNSAAGSVTLKDGVVTVGVAPLELVTLRSIQDP
jgi:hypothetical protein